MEGYEGSGHVALESFQRQARRRGEHQGGGDLLGAYSLSLLFQKLHQQHLTATHRVQEHVAER